MNVCDRVKTKRSRPFNVSPKCIMSTKGDFSDPCPSMDDEIKNLKEDVKKLKSEFEEYKNEKDKKYDALKSLVDTLNGKIEAAAGSQEQKISGFQCIPKKQKVGPIDSSVNMLFGRPGFQFLPKNQKSDNLKAAVRESEDPEDSPDKLKFTTQSTKNESQKVAAGGQKPKLSFTNISKRQ